MTGPTPDADWVRGAVACADVGAFAIRAETRAVQLDARAGEMLGLAADRELSLEEYLAVVEPSERTACARHIEAAVESPGDAYHDEFRTVTRRWIAADGRGQQHRASGRTVVLGLLTDVTLRRTTEDARSRLVDEMARALRFNDLMIGVVAHDLRNPLAAIALAAETMVDALRALRDRRLEATASRIARNTQRMSRIVDQMRDLTHTRIEGTIPLRVAPADLAAVAREVAVELAADARLAAIPVDVHGDTSCLCDADRVAQIVSHVLGNAIRQSPGGHGVSVVVDGTTPRAIEITVTNPGTIAPELMPTLFNPFRRRRDAPSSDDRERGLGLGLYVARRIAIGHGGDLAVVSADARTVFRVDIPRVATMDAFSLTPERADEEQISLQLLASSDRSSTVTAAMFGVLPMQERAPAAFATLVDRHARILDLSLARQIYRDARVNLAAELRDLAEHLGGLGAGAGDVAELHSQALQRATRAVPAVKMQALVSEGRLIALELMGRLLTYYRKRSGFGSLTRNPTESPP